MCLNTKNISLSYVHWCIINNDGFVLPQTLYISRVSLLAISHSSFFHLVLLISDNMSKSYENSKRGSTKEGSNVVGMHKDDKMNTYDYARIQSDTFARAFVVGRTSLSQMKNLKKKKDLDNESGLNTDEDWKTFFKSRGQNVDQV